MDIRSVTSAYGARAYEKSTRSEKKNDQEKSSKINEQVDFSETSKTLQKLLDDIAHMPEVRIPIVEDIQRKIKYNGYPIESKIYKSLEKLIEHEIV